MINKKIPFIRPYALVYNAQGHILEVISWPYMQGEVTLVKVRIKDDPTTMETANADELYPSNWNDYAQANNQCFVQAVKAAVDPVCLGGSTYFDGWNLFPPSPFQGSIHCKDVDEARRLAGHYGCTIIL